MLRNYRRDLVTHMQRAVCTITPRHTVRFQWWDLAKPRALNNSGFPSRETHPRALVLGNTNFITEYRAYQDEGYSLYLKN